MVRVTAPVPPPPPGKPRGNLEAYSFPGEAEVGKEYNWTMTVHNNGEASGEVGAGIGNMDGNPGNIVITVEDQIFEIPPGQVLIMHTTLNVCDRINLTGKIKFTAEGSYTLRLMGLHYEEEWVIDTYKDING